MTASERQQTTYVTSIIRLGSELACDLEWDRQLPTDYWSSSSARRHGLIFFRRSRMQATIHRNTAIICDSGNQWRIQGRAKWAFALSKAKSCGQDCSFAPPKACRDDKIEYGVEGYLDEKQDFR